jgi:hypothetical protein
MLVVEVHVRQQCGDGGTVRISHKALGDCLGIVVEVR